MMLCGVPPRGGGTLFAFLLLVGLGVQTPQAKAAEITWDKISPFQGCLAAGLKGWLDAQVDVLTNEDPATWKMDDRSVAAWTLDALAACKAKAGGGEEATEASFTRYMAHWRRHIYDLVENVRQRGKPD